MKDFGVRDGDLLLVMEVGQAIRLRDRLDGSRAQVALLGLWAHPFRIHIHDPVTLSDAYFDTCYALLETAVKGVVREWRAVDRSSNGRDSAG